MPSLDHDNRLIYALACLLIACVLLVVWCDEASGQSCDPWADTTLSPSPVIQWDEASGREGYRIYWRPEGGGAWNLYADLPCEPRCIDYDAMPPYDCNTTDPYGYCAGEVIGEPLQRYDGPLVPFERYEFAVAAYNVNGEGGLSNVVSICWYPSCEVYGPHPFGHPASCCDPSGPQEWCQ